jgi:3-phenylpropionate/cinnamic acid dioxygenase small subunit
MTSTDSGTLEGRIARLESRAAIQQLQTRYAFLIDDHEFDALGALFTVDAEFGSPGGTTRGRAAITAMYRDRGDLYPISLHVVHGMVLEFDDDDHAHAQVIGFSEQANAAQTVVTSFRYRDSYERVAGEWYFASRHVLTLYAMSHAELAAGGLSHEQRKRWPHRDPAPAELPVFFMSPGN